MARSTDVVADSPEASLGPDTCNVCQCEFSLDDEGGADGFIGIISVTFCPTCHAGLHDMYTAWYGEDDESGELVLLLDCKPTVGVLVESHDAFQKWRETAALSEDKIYRPVFGINSAYGIDFDDMITTPDFWKIPDAFKISAYVSGRVHRKLNEK